jgi:hypothetical protein
MSSNCSRYSDLDSSDPEDVYTNLRCRRQGGKKAHRQKAAIAREAKKAAEKAAREAALRVTIANYHSKGDEDSFWDDHVVYNNDGSLFGFISPDSEPRDEWPTW